MHHAGREQTLLDLAGQQPERQAAFLDPAAHRLAGKIDPRAREDALLPVGGLVVGVFRHDHVRQQRLVGQAAGHEAVRKRRHHHAVLFRARRAAVLGTADHPHIEPTRRVGQPLAVLVPDAGARRAVRQDFGLLGDVHHLDLAGQMRRQFTAPAGRRLARVLRDRDIRTGGRGLGRRVLLDGLDDHAVEKHLVRIDPLAPAPEQLPLHPLDLARQQLHLLFQQAKRRVLRPQHLQQQAVLLLLPVEQKGGFKRQTGGNFRHPASINQDARILSSACRINKHKYRVSPIKMHFFQEARHRGLRRTTRAVTPSRSNARSARPISAAPSAGTANRPRSRRFDQSANPSRSQ